MPYSSHAPGPVRLDTVDALRGIALFGILVVNIQLFSSAFPGLGTTDPRFDGAVDHVVRFVVALLFEGKFYLLFSFLFGYSVTLQAQAAQRDAADPVARMRRRLAMLWVLGATHAVLLFYGDILATYAVLGLVLLAWRDKHDRQLWQRAAWLLVVTAAIWAVVLVWLQTQPVDVDTPALVALAAQTTEAYTASAASAIAQNLRELPAAAASLILVQAPMALAMFCLGVAAGRHGFLAAPDRHAVILRAMRWGGLAIGLPGALFYAWTVVQAPHALIGVLIGLASAPFLTAAYIGWATPWLASDAGRMVRQWLAPAGRMALSHYLMQSVVQALVFYGYGLGWMGRLSPLAVLGVAASLFGAQLLISRWWMQRFAYGWMEWLLRAVTLGRRPDWRRPGSPR